MNNLRNICNNINKEHTQKKFYLKSWQNTLSDYINRRKKKKWYGEGNHMLILNKWEHKGHTENAMVGGGG